MMRDSGSVKLYCILALGLAFSSGLPLLLASSFRALFQGPLGFLDPSQSGLPSPQLRWQFISGPIPGSRRKVVFEESPVAAGVVGSVDEGPRSCGKTAFWFFHSSGTFHHAFARPIFIYAAGEAEKLEKAPQVSAWG